MEAVPHKHKHMLEQVIAKMRKKIDTNDHKYDQEIVDILNNNRRKNEYFTEEEDKNFCIALKIYGKDF
jgi:HD-GYP domain-containing protein (c-di-GMP phosphodiesterase class II)